MIHLTEAAARQIQNLRESKGAGGLALRVFVEEGGCGGQQYGMAFDEERPDDVVFESAGFRVVVSPASLRLLDGATVDFDGAERGKGLFFNNPHARRTCGCGRSFSTADEKTRKPCRARSAPCP